MEHLVLPSVAALESTETCELLQWDSEFFDLRIARATVRRLDAQTAAQVDDWCRAHQIHCLYFLTEATDGPSVRAAEDHGFRLVDIRLTLRCQLDGPISPEPRNEISVASAQASDVTALRAIAAASHRDTRFYFDANFARASCDRLYETWIERSCSGYADRVWVARFQDHIAGYLSCHRLDQTQGQIGLVGVDAAARGQQVGSAILEAGLGWFWEQGLRQVIVVTQGRNVPAQRLYQSYGFHTDRVDLWYHRWFRVPPYQQAAN